MRAGIAAAVFGAALVLDTANAAACDSPSPEPHVVDTTLADDVAPEPPGDISVLVRRGTGSESEGCGSQIVSSCDDTGSIEFLLNEPASDDQSSPQNIGYRLEVVDGAPPGALTFPADAVRAAGGTRLSFHWTDDDTDGQEIVAFSVTLTPVDAAGKVGEASAPVRVFDPGSTEACATTSSSRSIDAAQFLMLLGLLTGLCRTRRSKGAGSPPEPPRRHALARRATSR